MTSTMAPMCLACAAFPDSIPNPILAGEFDHRDLYPNDHGVRFDAIEDAPEVGLYDGL